MTLTEEEYKQELFVLKLLYGKVIEVIDATKSGYIMINDEVLNRCYIQLLLNIDIILKKKKFKNLNKEAPQIFDGLIGNMEEIDNSWEFVRNYILQFINKIHKEHIMAKVMDCNLSKEYKEFFNNIDKAVNEHKKNVKLHSKKLEKAELPKLNKLKEQFNKYKNDSCDVNDKEGVYYKYNENEKMGTLTINPYPKIEFSKTPALIVKYFFDSKDLDNSYKSYHDFQETYFIDKFTSDYFSKRIAKINEKISKDTENKIKKIICKEDKIKPTKINRYKWKIMT